MFEIPKTKNSSEPNSIQDRAVRLVSYLLELAQIRKKIIRDIDNYKSIRDYNSILWLSDIPHESRYCYSRSWDIDSDDVDSDIWIEVQKYDEPILEEIPEICARWVDINAMKNTEEIPELLASIVVEERIPNPDEDEDSPEEDKFITVTKKLHIEDYPDVSKTWDEFVDEVWIPWSDLHKKWQSIQNVYARLYSIYQLQQKLGEKFELILGLGALSWLTPSGHQTRRHLIIAKAELLFEARIGKFTVKPFTEGIDLSVEFDMLDFVDQPPKLKLKAEEMLNSANENPWDKEIINSVLKEISNSLSDTGEGEYHPENLMKPTRDKIQKKPRVDFSPALLLRERPERGFESILRSMKDQILSGVEMPSEFLDLCEVQITRDKTEEIEQEKLVADEIIYFPKPYNEEQLQIIEKFDTSSGVLVQGPPGTGKSHTIANLICHLLAVGKRVLVTAKTPRALKVLHEQLPKKTRPLCISLLGRGIEEQKSLENSVGTILQKQEKWRPNDTEQTIYDKHRLLDELKSEKINIENRMSSIRKADISEQDILGGAYKGTTANIAKKIRKEEKEFGWLKDTIPFNQEQLLSEEELKKLHTAITNLAPRIETLRKFSIPDPEFDFPSPGTMRELLNKEKELKERNDSYDPLLISQIDQIIENTDSEKLQTLSKALNELRDTVDVLKNRPMVWINEAIHDVLSDEASSWKDLLRVFSSKLHGLKQKAERLDAFKVVLSPHHDPTKLLIDVKQLKKHLDEGGKLGWGPIRPRVVRKNLYVIKEIVINGQLCRNSELMEILTEYLSVENTIDYCWNLWIGKAERKPGRAFLQVSELEEMQDALEGIKNLYDFLLKARNAIQEIRGLNEPKWYEIHEIDEILKICQAAENKISLNKLRNEWNKNILKVETVANASKTHPKVKEAVSALKKGLIDDYADIIKEISTLLLIAQTIKILSKVAPKFAQEILDNPGDENWPNRIRNIDKAWKWRRTKSFLEKYINKEDLPSLQRRLEQVEKSIMDTISELSAILAWKYCFSRMSESHRRSLRGWEQAIRKLGKGTGKHAPKHRRDAQHHLNQCKDAIPGWIMPLHRVYDSVKAAPFFFDIVIVDEASQCGFEALPLMYLTKKILIVGDDKQISPEAVGIDRATIFQKINEHLYDFEHKDSFDIESSLFDHGQRRFRKSGIMLLEHFRCMPEIIQFSNNNWYQSSLVPLRQYPPNRIDPLVPVYVSNGYRDGRGQKVVNRPEARILADKVIECCENQKYAYKTMGVIVLQGEAQASLIEEMLLNELGANEMENRKLICGNPYSFQGDERDVIFLSMVAAPNERSSALTKAYDQRRFNVACSRAKDQMWLFHSMKRNDLSKFCLRWKLLEYFEDPKSIIEKSLGIEASKLQILAHSANRQIEKAPDPYDSWFEVDVALEIASHGYHVIPQFKVAGKRIDLVVVGTESLVAIECDGDHWHGLDDYEKDMVRQRKLERSGWKFHRIRESAFYAFKKDTLGGVWDFLKQNGIRSVKGPISDPEARKKTVGEKDQMKSPYKEQELFRKTEKYTKPKYKVFGPLSKKSLIPENIKEALSLKPVIIGELIVETLKQRPNNSCVKDALPGLVLKHLSIVSRGKPREKFRRKIFRALKFLENESRVLIYKSVNIRVKLL